MNWYDYSSSTSANIPVESILKEELLNVEISNPGAQSLSGVARDFSLTETSTINFSIMCQAKEGAPLNYSLFIIQNNEIIKQYNYSFKDNKESIIHSVQQELAAGNYTILIGDNKPYNFIVHHDLLDLKYTSLVKNKPTHFKSMWCWSNNSFKKDISSVLLMTKRLSIDCIYQGDTDNLDLTADKAFNDYLTILHKNNIQLYLAIGEPLDYKNPDKLKKDLEKVFNFNQVSKAEKIDGVIFDVEPYTPRADDGTPEEERKIIWRKNAKEIYLYANEHKLKTIFCIPSWYSQVSIRNYVHYSDGISVMNYTVANMLTGLEPEINEVKLNGDWIENITEFQQPSESLPSSVTLYDKGLNYAHSIWSQLKKKYNYPLLSFSYHYFIPLLTLINDYVSNDIFTPIRTVQGRLNSIPILSGQILITIDTHNIYIDINERERILIGDTLAARNKEFDITLIKDNWQDNSQIIQNNLFLAKDYVYLISPTSIEYEMYCKSFIFADEVIKDGEIMFHCKEAPSSNLTVHVVRMEAE